MLNRIVFIKEVYLSSFFKFVFYYFIYSEKGYQKVTNLISFTKHIFYEFFWNVLISFKNQIWIKSLKSENCFIKKKEERGQLGRSPRREPFSTARAHCLSPASGPSPLLSRWRPGPTCHHPLHRVGHEHELPNPSEFSDQNLLR